MRKNAETYAEFRDLAVESAAKLLVHVGCGEGGLTNTCAPHVTVRQSMRPNHERICTEEKYNPGKLKAGKAMAWG